MSDQMKRLKQALAERYRIERELGAGGMATVYLAEDLRHQRKVALKVLRPELAAVLGGERFLSEIRTTANLQHLHILPLFDSGEADGFLYYVMPYIDGETLRDRLDREKQLGVEESIGIAKSVADALDYAHRNGVMHRDIKPANILLHDGRPVVADFGIAVAVSAAGGGRMTETGLSLGTPHYMSPEQASADRDLTARSDVYSLGCVLYEMVAGQPPHTGPSAQSILVRILTDSPRALTELRHTVPPHVSAVVMKAIEKLPADRFESARAFMDALDDPAFTWSAAPQATAQRAAVPAPAAAITARRPAWAVPAAFAVVAGVAGVVAGRQMIRPAVSSPAPRVVFELAADSSVDPIALCCGASEAVSPDGARLAHLGVLAGAQYTFVRPVDQLDAQPVRGSEGAGHPVFSADGTWLAFNTATALMKVPVEGGTPMTIADGVGRVRGIAWLEDNTIVFGGDGGGTGLYRVSADGGAPEPLTTPDSAAGEIAHRYPHALPGSSTVLFTVIPSDGGVPTIAALDLTSGRHAPLLRGTSAWYVNGGHVVYGLPDGSVMAQRLEVGRLDTIGGPFRIAENVIYRAEGLSEIGVSRTGTLISLHGAAAGANEMVIVDRSGRELPIPLDGPLRHPRFSPDGRYIVVEREADVGGGSDDIWLWDLTQQNATRITTEGDNSLTSWSPDGQSVLFNRESPGEGACCTSSASYRGPGGLFEVAVRAEGERLVLGQRSPILDTGPYRAMSVATTWDIHPDGDRFVLITGGAGSSLRYRVTLNATSRPGRR